VRAQLACTQPRTRHHAHARARARSISAHPHLLQEPRQAAALERDGNEAEKRCGASCTRVMCTRRRVHGSIQGAPGGCTAGAARPACQRGSRGAWHAPPTPRTRAPTTYRLPMMAQSSTTFVTRKRGPPGGCARPSPSLAGRRPCDARMHGSTRQVQAQCAVRCIPS
jgi:hypothetical protein